MQVFQLLSSIFHKQLRWISFLATSFFICFMFCNVNTIQIIYHILSRSFVGIIQSFNFITGKSASLSHFFAWYKKKLVARMVKIRQLTPPQYNMQTGTIPGNPCFTFFLLKKKENPMERRTCDFMFVLSEIHSSIVNTFAPFMW